MFRTVNSKFFLVSASFVALAFSTWVSAGHAASYVWNSAISANWNDTARWSPNADPNSAADDATINVTGSSYTVTVNAPRTIGTLVLDSADATLNASSILTVPTLANIQNGSLQGTLLMNNVSSALTLNRANVTITGATTYQFRRQTGGVAMSQTFNAGNLTANETLDILQTDGPYYPRASLTVTTTNGFTNNGTINIRPQGYLGTSLTYAVTNGGILNQSNFTVNSTGATLNDGPNSISTNLTNAASGTVTITAPTSSPINFTKAGGVYVNDGAWNVTGATGLYIQGGASAISFTQNTPGATLSASRMLFGAFNNSAQNTFSVTSGSISGSFLFGRTAVSLAGSTISGPTTLSFEGEDDNTLTLNGNTVTANMTLNVIGRGESDGTILSTPGPLNNSGTIVVRSPANGADFNNGLGRLIVGAGGADTLTNAGSLTVESVNGSSAGRNTFADLQANLVNQSGGIVDFLLSGSNTGTGTDQVRVTGTITNQDGGTINVNVPMVAGTKSVLLNSGSASFNNAGTLNLIAGRLDANINSFVNQSTGLIQGVGTLDVLGTASGLVNQGTLSPGLTANSVGQLNIAGSTTFVSGGTLVIDVLGGGEVAGVDYDQLAITGSASGLNNATLVINISDLLDTTDLEGDSLTLLTTTTGDLSSQSFDSVVFTGPWGATVQYLPNAVVLTNIGQVPEPGTGLLLLCGIVCAARAKRRSRKV